MGRAKRVVAAAAGVAIGAHVAPYALTLNCYTLSQYSKGLRTFPSFMTPFPSFLRRQESNSALFGIGKPGHVALTFDDGPDAHSTPKILEILDVLEMKATFFLLGEMTQRNPGVAKDVAERGHEIALHGYSHESYLRMHLGAAMDDVKRSREVVESATGQEVKFFRPPFGTLSASALGAVYATGLRPVLWSAWGRDWERDTTPVRVAANVVSGVLDGGTVLLHDADCASSPNSWKATLDALPLLADIFEKEGLIVGPLREHLV